VIPGVLLRDDLDGAAHLAHELGDARAAHVDRRLIGRGRLDADERLDRGAQPGLLRFAER
jgi:hypothetical protein